VLPRVSEAAIVYTRIGANVPQLRRTVICRLVADLVATPLPPTVLPLDRPANVPSGGDQTVNLT
jgi:hypothetical protein